MWFIENPGFVSGGSTLWCADLLGVSQAEVFALAATAEPGCKGLVFVPALSGSMAPRWNDLARGSFTGASMDHGQAEWCRAVLEGCAFALRDVVDRMAEMGLDTSDVRVTGGGARSELWMKIKADALGRVMRPVLGEGTATGAACLAAVTAGWYPDLYRGDRRPGGTRRGGGGDSFRGTRGCLPPLPEGIRCPGGHILLRWPTNLPFELVDSGHALESLPETVVAHQRPGPVAIMTDATPKFVAGDNLLDVVTALLPGASVVVLGSRGRPVLADEATISDAVAATVGMGCLVTLGSGTITDLGKLVSLASSECRSLRCKPRRRSTAFLMIGRWCSAPGPNAQWLPPIRRLW